MEQGTHDELLEIGPEGEYFRMWHQQQRNAELEAELKALQEAEEKSVLLDDFDEKLDMPSPDSLAIEVNLTDKHTEEEEEEGDEGSEDDEHVRLTDT